MKVWMEDVKLNVDNDCNSSDFCLLHKNVLQLR